MPQYNYSHKHVLVCSILDSLAHKDLFICCRYIFEFNFVVKLFISVLKKYIQKTYLQVKMCFPVGAKPVD